MMALRSPTFDVAIPRRFPHVSSPLRCFPFNPASRFPESANFRNSNSLVSLCARGDADCSSGEEVPDKGRSGKNPKSPSSWDAKDSEGRDYLYRLGQQADNMNIAVGARKGVIDNLFVGNFLGKDSDIVFAYRQKVTRSFEYIQGDYYIAPALMDKIGKFHTP